MFRPPVRVSGSHYIDVNLSRKEGALLVHLINTSGAHGSERTYIYDEITPLSGISVEADCAARPERVETVPAQPVGWTWDNGVLKVDLPRLDIYTIVVVKEGIE
jgi:hypothetical protein